MTRITEHTIEDFAIKLLEQLGYEYVYAPGIALTVLRDTLLPKLMSGEVRVGEIEAEVSNGQP
ncbi:hypothetical protein [Cyclonatronum proteinivorum]|nr:hypothetical protein [Cyclonatronum proteinivorum]